MKHIKIFNNTLEQELYKIYPCISTVNNTMTIKYHKKKNLYNGYEIAKGNVIYENSEIKISDNPFTTSYGKVFGENEGSTFFSYNTAYQININGWHTPTVSEYDTILDTESNKCTVNGILMHFAFISTESMTYNGILLFPDDENITGETIITYDAIEGTTNSISYQGLLHYLDNGCVFMGITNSYYNDAWSNGGGNYLTCEKNAWGSYMFTFYISNFGSNVGHYNISKPESSSSVINDNRCYGVRLIR